jgi:hypothetical protein
LSSSNRSRSRECGRKGGREEATMMMGGGGKMEEGEELQAPGFSPADDDVSRERERNESTFSTARQKQMTVSILGQALHFLSA